MYSKTIDVDLGNRIFKNHMEFFDSAMELYEVTKARPVSKHNDRLTKLWHDADWCGGIASTSEAVNLLYNGWTEKVPEVHRYLKSVMKTVTQPHRAFTNGPAGFAPVVPLAIQGNPNSMIADTRKPKNTKVVDIVYDFGGLSSTSADNLMWAGLKVMGYIANLERAGYRVRLSGAHWQANYDFGDAAIVRLKSENQPLDIKRLLFPMAHPGYFRIIHFGWYERTEHVRYYLDSYGQSLHRFDQITEDKIIKESFGPKTIYLSAQRMVDLRYRGEKEVDDYIGVRLEGVNVNI